MDLLNFVKVARRTGTPLIAIQSSDPAATRATIAQALNGSPRIGWNVILGCHPINSAGTTALLIADGATKDFIEAGDAEAIRERLAEIALSTQNPVAGLTLAVNLPRDSVFVMQMADRFYETPAQIQAVWNLRDEFKQDGRMLILLGSAFRFPVELRQDVLVFEEPLPADEDLKTIARQIFEAVQVEAPEDLSAPVTALRGLSAFAAEQVTAMAITKDGLDLPMLWDRKRKLAEQTPGIGFHIGGPTFDQIGGLERLIEFGRGLFAGQRPPQVVVQIDEFEKQLAGSNAQGDNGVGRDALQVILRGMVDHDYPGMMLVGPPGTGKTIYSESLAASHNVPLIKLDLSATKGSLMGESERGIREVFRTLHACAGQSGALFVACANSLDENIPPELRRRMGKLGIWYVDLPSAKEREAIWSVHLAKWSLDLGQERPKDANWSGSDIANCCELAWRLRCSLIEAAGWQVAVLKSDPDSVNRLRSAANGRWLSANSEGVYTKPQEAEAERSGRRQMEVLA